MIRTEIFLTSSCKAQDEHPVSRQWNEARRLQWRVEEQFDGPVLANAEAQLLQHGYLSAIAEHEAALTAAHHAAMAAAAPAG